jgi:cytochrome c
MTVQAIDDPQARADIIAMLRLAGPDGPTGAAASAPEVMDPDLKTQAASRQVRAIKYCGDTYRVTTEDGRTRAIWERNLRFQTDQSARGPKPGAPVIMPAGMMGDRASVIFAAPDEISGFIRRECQ